MFSNNVSAPAAGVSLPAGVFLRNHKFNSNEQNKEIY